MIAGSHRQKGGGTLLGAALDGEPGPFGVRGGHDDEDQEHGDGGHAGGGDAARPGGEEPVSDREGGETCVR